MEMKREKSDNLSKEDFSQFCRLLYERHLVAGVGGNVSARAADRIFITPSGYSLRAIGPEAIVAVDRSGTVLEGGPPTKDLETHLQILERRPELNVVCHVHGAFIVAVSCLVDPGPNVLPPVTPGFAYFSHPIAMIPFMVPGTKEFARETTKQFSRPDCRALLLQNHGLITAGENFHEAINIAEEMDEAARVYLLTEGKAKAIPAEFVRKIKGSA